MLFKSWGLEVLALIGSVGIGGAMIGLLVEFDGRPVFDWNSVTLNAVISTLSAVMKASLLFSVAECIGQWKWILLSRSKRNLIDFERVDLASRGPLGCFNLLWRRQTPLLLRLGLTTVILTVAVDPFSQQLLQLQQDIEYHDYIDMQQSGNHTYATTYRASYYNGGEQVNSGRNSTSLGMGRYASSSDSELRGWKLDFAMEAAILNSFAQDRDTVVQQSPTTCPTGNCTWDMFSTLGVCHKCNDLTSELEEVKDFGDFFNLLWEDDGEGDESPFQIDVENATAHVLPNGHFLANVNGCSGASLSCHPSSPKYKDSGDQDAYGLTAYSTGNWSRTVSLQNIDTLIRSMSVIYLDLDLEDKIEQEPWPRAPVTATECAVYYCVKEIEGEVRGNTLIENATEAESSRRVYYNRDNGSFESDGTPFNLEFEANITERGSKESLYLNYTDHTGRMTTSEMAHSTYGSISDFLKQTTRATWENETAVLERVRERIPGIEEMFNGAVVGESAGFKPNALEGLWSDFSVDLEGTFESLAISMTNEIRRKGETRFQDNQEAVIEGRIGVPRTAYKVAWYWFALHGVILSGCILFCVATAILSQDVPVWKSHSLATISQVPTVIDFGPGTRDLKELEKGAKSIEVSLSKDETNGHLLRRETRSNSNEDGTSEQL